MLEHTGQRTQGTSVWQAGRVIYGHHRALGRVTCLYSTGWIPYISLLSYLYNDFSVQVNLSLHTCKSFQDKRNDKVSAQQPLQLQDDTWEQGPAAWPCSSQHRGVSAAFIQQVHAWHQQNMAWLCLGASSPRGAGSLTDLEFSNRAFYLSVPCLKPKQMSFNYF